MNARRATLNVVIALIALNLLLSFGNAWPTLWPLPLPRLSLDLAAIALVLSVLSLRGGYTVGVYTGYDSNLAMVKRGTRVSGSVGALPAWADIAQAILDTERVADRLDMVDLAFNGLSLQYPDVQQVFLPVDPQQGGAPGRLSGALRQSVAPPGPATLSFGEVIGGERFEPERLYEPFWKTR